MLTSVEMESMKCVVNSQTQGKLRQPVVRVARTQKSRVEEFRELSMRW